MTESEAIEVAKEFISNNTNSYPIMPLDDFGNVDWEAYEPGGCPWNLLEEFSVYHAHSIISLDENYYTIEVHVGWKWSEDDEGEDDVIFEVYVPKDAEPGDRFDFDRVS